MVQTMTTIRFVPVGLCVVLLYALVLILYTSSVVVAFPNSHNIRAAMEAADRYGIHSPQAKLAWETVEDMSSRDNSAAYERNADSGLTPEQLQQAYNDVQRSVQTMQRRQQLLQYNQHLMNMVAAELQAIKLLPPTRKPPPQIPGLWDAKLKARAASQIYGLTSTEARLAWEEVEELASAGLEGAAGSAINNPTEEACSLNVAAEACMALEELDRFLYQDNYDNGTF
jgi:hypothetical protein